MHRRPHSKPIPHTTTSKKPTGIANASPQSRSSSHVNITSNANAIKCNQMQCQFHYSTKSTKPPIPFQEEVFHAVSAMHNGLFHNKPSPSPCNKPTCSTCPLRGHDPYLTSKGKNYKTATFNCKTTNVIYAIRCKTCDQNYIGLTSGTLHRRIQQHIRSINHKTPTGVSIHFRQHNEPKRHLEVYILDHHPNWNRRDLHTREAVWIHLLRGIEDGLNIMDERGRKLNINTLAVMDHYRHSKTAFPHINHYIKEINQAMI